MFKVDSIQLNVLVGSCIHIYVCVCVCVWVRVYVGALAMCMEGGGVFTDQQTVSPDKTYILR